MSLNKLTENTIPKSYLNPYFNNVFVANGANFNGSALTGVGSINGIPIPPLGLDPNPVNVIYKPGTTTVPGSNIVGTWAEVVTKAGRINVSQTLNIYFDDFVESPCPITSSIDFHGRTYFYSASERLVSINIASGVTITNLRGIRGPYLYVTCTAITEPSLAFTSTGFTVNTLEISNNCQLDTTISTNVPVISLNNQTLVLYLQNNGSINNSGDTLIPTIYLGTNSLLYMSCFFNYSGMSNNLIGDDGTGTLDLYSDASIVSFPTNSGFTGTYNKNVVDNSSLVEYKDNITPTFGSSNVQGSLDYIKQNYQKSSSTSPMTAGAISCTSLSSSGTMSCGTNSMTCGALSSAAITSSGTFSNGTNSISCGAITSSGNFSNGTNSSTTGALSCSSLLSSGTASCGTNALTCGALSCAAIISTGTFSNGTNAMTSGAHTCTSLTSTGTISCGTNAMTCGALSSAAILSSGTFSNGTNAMTSGAHSVTSLLSSGTMSCGVNAFTCGALSSAGIVSSGNFNNGTNSMTTGTLSCAVLNSSGGVNAGTNPMTCGALSVGSINATNNITNGTNSMTTGALSCGTINSSNNFTNGTNSMTTGALSCTSLTDSGTMSCGTNAMTCGALSCTSINSSGNIVFPYYSLSADLNTTQSIPNSANTLISFNQVQLNNNWGTVTPPVSSFTIPVAGWYKCTFSCVWDSNATGERQLSCFLNGGTRFFGPSTITACQTDKTRQCGSFQWQFAGGEALTIVVFQSSGGAINIGSEACYFAIDRDHT